MTTVSLRYEDLGDGPAVVLVHGHPFDRRMWAPQLTPLRAAGFRVIAPDLRGYGESPVTPGVVSMRDLASDVWLLLDELGLRTVAVVGLSMGGLVAMELQHLRPDGVWAVGLVATTAEPVTAEEAKTRLAVAEQLEAEGMPPLASSMSERLYGPHCPPDVIACVDQMMRDNNPLGAAAAVRGRASRPDYRGWLQQIAVPTWVCVGTADTWSTDAVTAQLRACLRDPRMLSLGEVGHLPNLEAPERFNRELIDFLTSARRELHQLHLEGKPREETQSSRENRSAPKP